MSVVAEATPLVEGDWLRLNLVAQPHSWVGLAVVVGNAGDAGDVSLDDLVARLDETERRFAASIAAARLPRSHPERAADALAVLRACTY